jgi:hypothetical protein
MKKLFAFLYLLIFIFAHNIQAQETGLIDWDIDSFDSIFDEPWPESAQEQENEENAPSVLDSVKKRGLVASVSYEFQGSIAPGWNMRPWEFNGDEVFSWGQGVKMNSSITLDARLSENFRVITTLGYSIPGFYFTLGDFFFDYNFFNTVFFRAGKYEHTWGISGFTNLLARVPDGSSGGPSYVLKADIPIGVGGIQALALTRADVAGGVVPTKSDIGFGGKYNLAFRSLDLDTGVFYQDNMPLRGFLSFKTTIFDTELYNEWLLAVNTHADNETSFAVNLGWGRDFFDGKVTAGGEFFFNGEGTTYFFRPETSLRDAETVPFTELFSMSFSILYRFSALGDPRFFVSVSYLPSQASAQLIPGFRITPISNIEVYLAVPMALGSKDSYYYNHTADVINRPFSVMLYVTLSDSVQAGSY